MRPGPKSGFSLLEAIIALAIGALVLSAVFAFSRNYVDTSGRLVRNAGLAADVRVAHTSFVALLGGVQAERFRPDDPEPPLRGDALRLAFVSTSDRAAGCMRYPGRDRIEMTIETDGVRGQLVCAVPDAPDGYEAVIHAWSGPGGRFRYLGPDGTWSDVWPPTAAARARGAEPSLANYPRAVGFEWPTPRGIRRMWVAAIHPGPVRPLNEGELDRRMRAM